MKSAHLQACDLVDQLDELTRARPTFVWRENWTAHVRRVCAELRAKLIEADREVADAFDARHSRYAHRKPCAWCGGPLPTNARADATTCSKRCRQAKHRGGSGKKVRLWPKGMRTRRAAACATDATSNAGDNRRKRRASLSADDWRSPERRAQREQLTIIAPPIVGTEEPHGE